MTTLHNPDTLVPPVGPYSQISHTGDLVYLAGQTGVDINADSVGEDIGTQAAQAMENIRLALESQGLTLANVMKLTTYVAGRDQLPGIIDYMDEAFPNLFPGGCPPNTLLVIEQLVVPELHVEFEAIAHA